MNKGNVGFTSTGTLLLVLLFQLATGISRAGSDECEMAGELTGGVYQWSPGDNGLEMIQGTELPYANGIEVSADEQEIFVAVSGDFKVIAYSRTNPARQLRVTGDLEFIPDNLHMDSDGRLITAGLVIDDPVCGNLGATARAQSFRVLLTPLTYIPVGEVFTLQTLPDCQTDNPIAGSVGETAGRFIRLKK